MVSVVTGSRHTPTISLLVGSFCPDPVSSPSPAHKKLECARQWNTRLLLILDLLLFLL